MVGNVKICSEAFLSLGRFLFSAFPVLALAIPCFAQPPTTSHSSPFLRIDNKLFKIQAAR